MTITLIITLSVLIYLIFSYVINRESPLELMPKKVNILKKKESIEINGVLEITNPHKRMEVMIPQFKMFPLVLSEESTDNIKTKIKLKSNNPELKKRKDGYWQTFIIKNKSKVIIDFFLILENVNNTNSLKDITSVWFDIIWINYGPFGIKNCRHGFVTPIKFPESNKKANNTTTNDYTSIPIRTHKLGILDDPVSTLYKYTSEKILPGDIVTIGETPLAIMQGRYIHPSMIRTSPLSKLLCYFFHPTSSLATACGMQSLINEVGVLRVIIAWSIGSFFKIFNIKGMFYRLAGEQARLIDDITGTTVPYDQVIVLGPKNVKSYCQEISNNLGVHVAVVDVNDLGKVKILASSQGANKSLIISALRSNPAGNADEQTPLVIIRPN